MPKMTEIDRLFREHKTLCSAAYPLEAIVPLLDRYAEILFKDRTPTAFVILRIPSDSKRIGIEFMYDPGDHKLLQRRYETGENLDRNAVPRAIEVKDIADIADRLLSAIEEGMRARVESLKKRADAYAILHEAATHCRRKNG